MAPSAPRPSNSTQDATKYFCPKPLCGRELRLKYANGGKNAGRHYVNCTNPAHAKEYWRFFCPDQLHTSTSTSSTSTSAPAGGRQVSAVSPQCSYLRSCRLRVNCLCETGKCKAHCIDTGGCRCPGHRVPEAAPAPFLQGLYQIASNLVTPRIQFTPRPDPEELRLRHEKPHWFASPSPSPPQTSTASRSFILVDFAKDAKSAVVQTLSVNGLYWIRPGSRPYECYSPEYSRWMPVEASYVHRLHDKQRILIRSVGVTGSDEALQISILRAEAGTDYDIDNDNDLASNSMYRPSSRLTLSAPVLHHHLEESRPAPRKTVKRKYTNTNDDEDIQITGYRPAIKQEPLTMPAKHCYPRACSPTSSSPFPASIPLPAPDGCHTSTPSHSSSFSFTSRSGWQF
ncbi:hypothetical protein B0H14DRAFT_3691062 [Mycena olivaceomarginata]|nr:hypothetical protein B0H14DRAFT_3691062 [Mycena olivaceomarginata]